MFFLAFVLFIYLFLGGLLTLLAPASSTQACGEASFGALTVSSFGYRFSVCVQASRWIDDKKEAARNCPTLQRLHKHIHTHTFECGLVTQLSNSLEPHIEVSSPGVLKRILLCSTLPEEPMTHITSLKSVLAVRAVFMIHFLGML